MLFSSPLAKGPVAASTSRPNSSWWSRSASSASSSFRMVAPKRKCSWKPKKRKKEKKENKKMKKWKSLLAAFQTAGIFNSKQILKSDL